jgi:hypothetical protein
VKLCELASFIKSSNAGATALTFDIGFDDPKKYQHVLGTGAISPQSVAKLYRLTPEQVEIFNYTPALAIKITMPRPVISGGVAERDFDGVQQFAPLLDIEVPEGKISDAS